MTDLLLLKAMTQPLALRPAPPLVGVFLMMTQRLARCITYWSTKPFISQILTTISFAQCNAKLMT